MNFKYAILGSAILLFANLALTKTSPPTPCNVTLSRQVLSVQSMNCSLYCPANTTCNAVIPQNSPGSNYNVTCTPNSNCPTGSTEICQINGLRGQCNNGSCQKCPSGETSLLDHSLPKTLGTASCQAKSVGDTCEQDGECLETTNGLSCFPSSVCQKEGASCNLKGVLGRCNANNVCVALPVSTQSGPNCQTYSLLPNSLLAFLFLVLARQLITIQRKKTI